MAELECNCLGSAVNVNRISGLEQESLSTSAFGCCHNNCWTMHDRGRSGQARKNLPECKSCSGLLIIRSPGPFEDCVVEMKISPSALAVFFGLAGDGPSSLQLEHDGLRVLRKTSEEFFPFEQIDEFYLQKHLISASTFIMLKNGSFLAANWLSKGAAAAFYQESFKRHAAYGETLLAGELQERSPSIIALAAQIRQATSGTCYLRYRSCDALLTQLQRFDHLLKLRQDLLPNTGELRAGLDLITKFASASESARQNCNRQFAQNEKERFREFFDHIEVHPLTDAQRSAVVTDEDNTLVIAGAGSGKTSVILAKAGYLVKREICRPERILLLTFNRDAKEEIEERLEQRVGVTLKAATFHSLGLEILASARSCYEPPRSSALPSRCSNSWGFN